MFIWGSATEYKLGNNKAVHSVDDPLYAEFAIEKTGYYTQTGQPAVR